jgi:hypothetical protein
MLTAAAGGMTFVLASWGNLCSAAVAGWLLLLLALAGKGLKTIGFCSLIGGGSAQEI